jgi:O-antigen/teichoic acid export membrane protein
MSRRSVSRGLSSILLGVTVGQGLVLVLSPLLARLYSTSDFGRLTVFTSVVAVLSVVSTLRFEAAIPLPKRETEAATVALVAVCSAAAAAALIAAVGAVAGQQIFATFGAPDLGRYWWLLAATVFAVGVNEVFTAWMTRHRRYGGLGARNAVMGVAQAGTQVGLGVLGARPLGLLVGLGAGRLAGLAGLTTSRGPVRDWRHVKPSDVAAVASRYRRFPLVSTWSALLNSLGAQAPFILVGAFYGPMTLGLLGLTVRVLAAPVAILGQAVAALYRGEASAAIRDEDHGLLRSFRSTVSRLLLLGLVPAACLMAAGPRVFPIVFGEHWTEAGTYAQLLAVGYLAQFAVSPTSQLLVLLELQGTQLAWDIGRLAVSAGCPLVCALVDAPPVVAVGALAAAQVASYGCLYLLCARAAKRHDARALGSPVPVS